MKPWVIAPQLVDALADNQPAPASTSALIDRAHGLAANKSRDSVSTATARSRRAESAVDANSVTGLSEIPGAAATVTLDADDPGATTDPDAQTGLNSLLTASAVDPSSGGLQLIDIYVRETATHVAAVRAFIALERDRSEPHAVTEAVYRACHTLTGSSRMAEVRHGIRLMAPCDHWLRKAFDSGVGIESSDLDLLEQCMTAMESVADNLGEQTSFFVSHESLLGGLRKLSEHLIGGSSTLRSKST